MEFSIEYWSFNKIHLIQYDGWRIIEFYMLYMYTFVEQKHQASISVFFFLVFLPWKWTEKKNQIEVVINSIEWSDSNFKPL